MYDDHASCLERAESIDCIGSPERVINSESIILDERAVTLDSIK